MVFKLRPETMHAFERDQHRRFVDQVSAHLRKEFPDAEALPGEELRSGVVVQLRKAEGYGLETELEQATYATSAWLLGDDFDTRFPAAEAVLNSARLTSEEKRQWLEDFTREIFARLEKN
jgi:hypothetical protein